MTRALRLHELHTRAELVAMVQAIHDDPEQHETPLQLTRKARQRLDDLLLALYWHDAPRGNTRQRAAQPQTKWW